MSHRVLITELGVDELEALALDATQYEHVYNLLLRLKDFSDPEQSSDLDIRRINDGFYEVRRLLDKGGALRARRVQVFFGAVDDSDKDSAVVILSIKGDHEEPDSVDVHELEFMFATYLADRNAVRLVEEE